MRPSLGRSYVQRRPAAASRSAPLLRAPRCAAFVSQPRALGPALTGASDRRRLDHAPVALPQRQRRGAVRPAAAAGASGSGADPEKSATAASSSTDDDASNAKRASSGAAASTSGGGGGGDGGGRRRGPGRQQESWLQQIIASAQITPPWRILLNVAALFLLIRLWPVGGRSLGSRPESITLQVRAAVRRASRVSAFDRQ